MIRRASIRACRMHDKACHHTHVQAVYDAERRRRHGRTQRGLFVRGHQHAGDDRLDGPVRPAGAPFELSLAFSLLSIPRASFSSFSSLFSISPLCLSLCVSVILFFSSYHPKFHRYYCKNIHPRQWYSNKNNNPKNLSTTNLTRKRNTLILVSP